ncbi:MAG: PrgI family protein [Candidatus Saccharibacteria bacterium]|nr:PrgI family protein [Candidatus Saccharibacteria bacterium]
MSRYKVAQDVEAEDKILGPFSFRQFIYLLVAVTGIALAWGLSQVFLPLAVIPVPIILLFGALALPLRKDQPMEVYLAAVVSFYTKPRRRMWQPDGINSLIEITVPEKVEIERTKNLSQDEAERRLAYLSQLADTHGWSIRHTHVPDAQGSMISDVYFEAQQTSDMFDDNSSEARAMTQRIEQSNQARRRAAIERMQAPPAALPAVADGQLLQQAPVPYQPAWPQAQAQQQLYHTAPQATPNTPPQATPPYQPPVGDAGFAPVSPPQPRMPEPPYSAPEPQPPAVSYSSTSFPENRTSSSHQQAPSPDTSAYQNQPNPYPPQQSTEVYEISPVGNMPHDETPAAEPQPMPRERDSLQSLPMALPAVIPHDSVLPDALSKPYTPPEPTAEAAPEPKPEEAPSFEAIYANLRQHAAPTTDAVPLVPPQKSAARTTTTPSYPSAEAPPPANTQPSFTPAPAEQPTQAAQTPNYPHAPTPYPPQQPPVAPAQPTPTPAPTPAAVSYRDRSALADDKNVIDMAVRYNPYPSIHQSVIQPLDPSYYAKTTPTREERLREEQLTQQRNNIPPNTSTNTVSPDIIRLASNSDLSVAAIANEANRIQHQEQASQDDDDDEIVIPLR